MVDVHPSGYYAWRSSPLLNRQREDARLLGHIKQFWLESGGVYGYRKITADMRDIGESCGKHRVYRLMKAEGLRSQTGYHKRPGGRYSKPSQVAPNHVSQQFNIKEPNKVWVTDITYIRTHEGLLYLKGHPMTGGIRASLYNAMPDAGVIALTDFMQHFAEKYRYHV